MNIMDIKFGDPSTPQLHWVFMEQMLRWIGMSVSVMAPAPMFAQSRFMIWLTHRDTRFRNVKPTPHANSNASNV
jgi:hypothetical protein